MSVLHSYIKSLVQNLYEIKIQDLQNTLLSKDALPFQGLFDEGELRKATTMYSDLGKYIEEIFGNHGISIDKDSGMAFYEKETKMGSKKVEVKPGKIFNKLIKSKKKELYSALGPERIPAFEKVYKKFGFESMDFLMSDNPKRMKWLKSNGLNDSDILALIREYIELMYFAKELSDEGSLVNTIIISRAPIDVLRMSDFKNIQSCHSPYKNSEGGGGRYWHCAQREAQEGGAIAYLVPGPLPANFDINAPEIFEDPHREVEGLKPSSRIRLRNFYNTEKEYELAVPEVRVYGQDVPGFQEALSSWALEGQEEFFEYDENGENYYLPNMENFVMRGGTYRDNPASVLFNKFFDTEEYSGDIRSENPDEEQTIEEQYYEEANQFENEFLEKLQNVEISVEWQMGETQSEDDPPFVEWTATISFPYGQYEDFYPSNSDIKEIARTVEYEGIRVDDWRVRLSDEHSEDAAIEFELHSIEESRGHPDEFKYFLNSLLEYDGIYQQVNQAVQETIQALIRKEQEEDEEEQSAMDKDAEEDAKKFPDLDVYDDDY